MSETDTEQAVEQVASPAEVSGVSPELAAVAEGKYAHIMEDMAEENGLDVPRETSDVTEGSESTEETAETVESEESSESAEESDEKTWDLKVKGRTTSGVKEAELIALAQKGLRFTQKTQELSEHAKLGMQLQLAKDGDKAAQKAILNEWAKSGDLDDLVDSLENVEGKIDTSAIEQAELDRMQMQSAFDGVDLNSADFNKNSEIIYGELKEFFPEAVFSEIDNNPSSLRKIYDLVDSGDFQKTHDTMVVQMSTMEPSEQSAIMSNPAKFAEMFDTIHGSLTSGASSNTQNTQAQVPVQAQEQAQPAASPVEEPPSMLSGTKREVTAGATGDVDFTTDDKAYYALLNKIKKGNQPRF